MIQECLLLTPEYSTAHYHMGMVLCRLGRYGEGKQQLEGYLEDHPWDAPTKYHLGMIAAREGDRDAATKYLSGIPEFKAGIPEFKD